MNSARNAEEKSYGRDDSLYADGASRRPEGGERQDGGKESGACLSNTPLHSSHNPFHSSCGEIPVVAIDWLQVSGVIQWDLDNSCDLRENIERLYTTAVELESPQPVVLNELQCLIQPRGFGSGRQSRKTIRITCGNMTFGLSFRENASRQNSNYALTIPGEMCLSYGALTLRDWAHMVIEDLGGKLTDEWVSRVDVCIDLPGVNPREELLPACGKHQYTSTVDKGVIHFDKIGETGFTIGSMDRLQLQIYDKYLQTLSSTNPHYVACMMVNRWNGNPKHATRVELRIGRQWINQWKNDNADAILNHLGSVVERILGDQSRTFFKLLDATPDRKNKHQSRVSIHPLWKQIRDRMIEKAGEGGRIFSKVERGTITLGKAYRLIRSVLAKAAAIRGCEIHSIQDALDQLESLNALNDGTDSDWKQIWMNKRNELGILTPADDFEFGANVETSQKGSDWD